MPVVYPHGMVIFLSLGYFLSVDSSSKPYHPSLPLSLRVNHIQDYFKNKKGGGRKCVKPQEEKARREQCTKQMRVTV